MSTQKKYLYLGSDEHNPTSIDFEFDESDIWNSAEIDAKRPFYSAKRFAKRNDRSNHQCRVAVPSASLPVNVMDWSKILRGEFKNRTVEIDDDDDENEDEKVPPHEYLARTRVASCSVHEGVGRTLKGRDMRMVRNAVWKYTGFED